MGSKDIKSHKCSLERPHTVSIKLNSELALFKQKQILRSDRQKNLQKHFFIQLVNAWLYFTSNNFPTFTSRE